MMMMMIIIIIIIMIMLVGLVTSFVHSLLYNGSFHTDRHGSFKWIFRGRGHKQKIKPTLLHGLCGDNLLDSLEVSSEKSFQLIIWALICRW